MSYIEFEYSFFWNDGGYSFDATYNYSLVALTEIPLKRRASFEENGVTYTHGETYSHETHLAKATSLI